MGKLKRETLVSLFFPIFIIHNGLSPEYMISQLPPIRCSLYGVRHPNVYRNIFFANQIVTRIVFILISLNYGITLVMTFRYANFYIPSKNIFRPLLSRISSLYLVFTTHMVSVVYSS